MTELAVTQTEPTVSLKMRYAQLLRKYIQTMDQWTAVSGGGLVTGNGYVLPNYAPSKARALKEIQDNLDSYEPDETEYALLKSEFLFSLKGARNVAGDASWVKRTMTEVEKGF
jgi:hypothetical protein